MTGEHEIVVALVGDSWRVSIVPPVDSDDEPVIVSDLGMAMARARLMRLRHGFPIIGPSSETGRTIKRQRATVRGGTA